MNDAPASTAAKDQLKRLAGLLEPYEAELERVVAFWLERCLDHEHGGYRTQISRRGVVFGEDKNIWVQARQAWTFAALYNQFDPRDAWLEAAQLGRDFLVRHADAGEGRWHYLLDRHGGVLDSTVSLATDCNVMMALAEFASASGRSDDHAAIEATWDQFEAKVGPPAVDQWHHFSLDPSLVWLMPHMLVVGAAPTFRLAIDPARVDRLALDACRRILDLFANDRDQRVYEVIHTDGSPVDSDVGRRLNPGHAFEASWFCLEEASRDGTDRDVERAVQLCRWCWTQGWDARDGGIFAFTGLDGAAPPGSEYISAWGDRWDDKLWWAQSESLYALALAASVSGDGDLVDAFEQLSGFVQAKQIDHEYGEWYECLHRHGEVRSPLKGSWIKCMFHVTRNLMKLELLRRRLSDPDASRRGE